MKYILVANKQTVLLGPIHWRPRQFQAELDDLEIAFLVPIQEQGYVYINNVYEIFPVVNTVSPDIDGGYEEPIGPTYSYLNNEATETYTKKLKQIEIVKDWIKDKVSEIRYIKENAGFEITVKGFLVFLDSSRENRSILAHKYAAMGAGNTVKWKFRRRWIEITKAELNWVITQINDYVDTQFTWENTLHESIDAAANFNALKTIVVDNNLLNYRQV